MNHDSLDQQVAHLMHKLADGTPKSVDLLPRIHQQLTSSSAGSSNGMSFFAHLQAVPRWSYMVVSMVLVAGLLFSGFAFARPLIFSWLGDNGLHGVSLHGADHVGSMVTMKDITLQVEQVYADAARTAITMRLQAPHEQGVVTPRLDQTYLLDSQGHRYAALTGTQVDGEGLFEFIPLPLDALNSEQSLTLAVESVFPSSGTSPITGPWQVHFKVHTQAVRSITFTQAPDARHGVTVQPVRLDVTSTGARLLMRFSGLAPNTSLFDLTQFAQNGGDAIVGCPPNTSVCVDSHSTSDGALLHLQGGDKQVLEPSWVVASDPGTSGVGLLPKATQTVGPDGSALIEILFFTPLRVTNGDALLTIDQLPLRSAQLDANGQEQIVNGPWSFILPL
jgi:hypothetical protein